MLLESLKLLIHAAEEALMSTCNLAVDEIAISQVRQGQITFPSMAKIEFTGGSLQGVRLGGDSLLCGHLAELVGDSKSKSGIECLANRFLAKALDEMEGRYPRGQIEDLDVGPRPVYVRGTRSFGLRFRTDIGQFFLLAEVPSRVELEVAKGSEFLGSMISTYLPRDWVSRETMASRSEIDSLLVFLRKVESDIHVEFPLGDDRHEVRTGLLLEQCTVEGKRALRVNLNLDLPEEAQPQIGDVFTTFVGVQDRSIEMDLEFLGSEAFSVTAGGVLHTAILAIPELLRVTQRRRAFRIDLLSTVPVEVEAIDEDCTTAVWFGDEELGSGASGRLVDLSFSGARIIGDPEEFCTSFPENTRVRCRIFFPDEPKPVQILGIIRRSDSKLVGRDSFQDEVGIEFLVAPEIDRYSLDIIREYVLKEQRSLLARRVHVPGAL